MKFKTITATLLSSLLALHTASAITIDAFEGDGQVISSSPGVAVETTVANPLVVGGVRTLATQKVAGPTFLRLETILGVLNHSQNVGTSGISTLTWDGNSDPASVAFNGLGTLDFTKDGGDAFSLNALYFDYAGNQSIQVELKVYDGSDLSGGTFGSATVTLDRVYTNENLLVPFSGFTPTGSFSFTRVGAVQMKVLGLQPAFDLGMDSITTNGGCTHAPAASSTIKDDCGVCNGNNEAKDECGVCFGNNAAKDSCGVCFGSNLNVDNCGVCFGNNASKDICGICGGNGTSCVDCAGVVNGIATRDDCGVCAGDGSSCRICQSRDLMSDKEMMRADALRQRDEALFFALRIKSANRKLYRASLKQVNAAYAMIVARISALPDTNLSCEPSTTCVTQNANVPTINVLKRQIKIVYDRSVSVLSYPIAVGDGKCRDSVEECRARVKARAREGSTLRTLARRLYRKLRVTISGLPVSFSVCSPASSGLQNPPGNSEPK